MPSALVWPTLVPHRGALLWCMVDMALAKRARISLIATSRSFILRMRRKGVPLKVASIILWSHHWRVGGGTILEINH